MFESPIGEAGKREILQQMFRKFSISNRLSNIYFPKIDVGCPWFYHLPGNPIFSFYQKAKKFTKKTSREQAIVPGDGRRVNNVFEGHKMLTASSIKLITELINSNLIFNLILAEH